MSNQIKRSGPYKGLDELHIVINALKEGKKVIYYSFKDLVEHIVTDDKDYVISPSVSYYIIDEIKPKEYWINFYNNGALPLVFESENEARETREYQDPEYFIKTMHVREVFDEQ